MNGLERLRRKNANMKNKSNIEVRRNNGQNAYGLWVDAADQDVPEWVREYAGTEQIEDKAAAGQVERGGSKWDWRAASADEDDGETATVEKV